jgi:hypothetical protein
MHSVICSSKFHHHDKAEIQTQIEQANILDRLKISAVHGIAVAIFLYGCLLYEGD